MVNTKGRFFLRSWVVILTLALTLAGFGRVAMAFAPALDAPPILILGGLVVPICQAAPTEPAQRDHGATHQSCCDDCTLCAPALLPILPACPLPLVAARISTNTARLITTPRFDPSHQPRQAQAPPIFAR